jgi:hypothetical protein
VNSSAKANVMSRNLFNRVLGFILLCMGPHRRFQGATSLTWDRIRQTVNLSPKLLATGAAKRLTPAPLTSAISGLSA